MLVLVQQTKMVHMLKMVVLLLTESTKWRMIRFSLKKVLGFRLFILLMFLMHPVPLLRMVASHQ